MKKLMINLSATLFFVSLAVQVSAQSPNVDGTPAPAPDSGASFSAVTPGALLQTITAGTVVIGKNFTITPGHYLDFRLGTTYSLDASSDVAISILSANQNLEGTFIVPYFAAPGAFYTAIDLIDCSQFNFFTQGGQVVPVYGTHLVVRVFNLSDRPVTYYQLMVHWAGH